MEEIESFLNTLQMDREYSFKLRDSLVEEFHRLKKLKKEILKQVVYIPPHIESLISRMNLQNELVDERSKEIELFVNPGNSKETEQNKTSILKSSPYEENGEKKEEKIRVKHLENQNNSSNLMSEKKISREEPHENSKKHSPFIFKFE